MKNVHRSELQQRLDTLWSSVIKELKFDPLRNTIEFSVYAVDNGKVTHSKLVFEQVAAYYLWQDIEDRRTDFYEYEEGDRLEVSLVQHFPDGLGRVGFLAQGEWDRRYNFTPNFVIEMDVRHLYLEAGVVVIDEERIKVGFAKS